MITVTLDSFEDCAEELAHIFPRHWAELALYQERMSLAPQYGEYVRREKAGNLLLVTARIDGNIVAYYTVQIAYGFHYSMTLTAHMDMMYIVPEVRGRGLVMPLMRRVEEELKKRGVQLWYSGHKAHNPLGLPRVLDLFGFQPADVYYSKWLGQT